MNSALLSQIQNGKKLKKAVTNDRSAPLVGNTKSSGGNGGGGGGGGGIPKPPMPGMGLPPTMSHTASAPPTNNIPSGPQLGGLFVNGMPTLRKTRGSHVDTGRETSSPVSPPPPPPPTNIAPPPPPPGRAPTFNKTPVNNTLPKNFKVPPPIPGKGSSSFNQSSNSLTSPPPPPPPPPTKNQNSYGTIPIAPPINNQNSFGAVPPAPPAPPPPPPIPGVGGIPPKKHSSLVPPLPGRTRSNSSPQRPIPPPPPPSQTNANVRPPVVNNMNNMKNSSASLRGPPKIGLPTRPNIPKPPTINNSQSSFSPPPPPPPPPSNTSNLNQRNSTILPPPSIPVTPVKTISVTEGGGRYTFRQMSDLPTPKARFSKKHRVYPSGQSRGNSYPLDYSKFR